MPHVRICAGGEEQSSSLPRPPPETSLDVLHLNVEFDAKCLSHMKVVFQPARTPHNLPHRLRVLRCAEARLGVMRAAAEL